MDEEELHETMWLGPKLNRFVCTEEGCDFELEVVDGKVVKSPTKKGVRHSGATPLFYISNVKVGGEHGQ
jgi:hypothetical protein